MKCSFVTTGRCGGMLSKRGVRGLSGLISAYSCAAHSATEGKSVPRGRAFCGTLDRDSAPSSAPGLAPQLTSVPCDLAGGDSGRLGEVDITPDGQCRHCQISLKYPSHRIFDSVFENTIPPLRHVSLALPPIRHVSFCSSHLALTSCTCSSAPASAPSHTSNNLVSLAPEQSTQQKVVANSLVCVGCVCVCVCCMCVHVGACLCARACVVCVRV